MPNSSLKKKKASKKAETRHPAEPFKIQTPDIFPLIFLLLYIITGIIPPFGAVDVMGSQWLYVACLNIISLTYIIWRRPLFYAAARRISSSLFSFIYIGLFIVAGLSIFTAINKTESFVAYARLLTTIGAFFSMSVLLYDRMHLFTIIGRIIVLLLFIECFQTLSTFYNGFGDTEFDKLVFSLTGNTGNKNVLAASIAIKIPFAIYYLRNLKIMGRVLAGITIGMAALCIFIINARSTYISLLLVVLIYGVYCINMASKKETDQRESFIQFGYVFLPVLFAFIISQQIIKRGIELQQAPSLNYGTVTKRLSNIGFTSEGSGGRTLLWANAIDYIKKHPFKGCGYGNWKLAAIPYDRFIYDDFNVSNHTHNDFLEITAEAGWIAGVLYFTLFICIAFYIMKKLFSKTLLQVKQLPATLVMALTVYLIDASLNFPAERPVMQIYFVLIAALSLDCFSSTKKNNLPPKTNKAFWPLIPIIGFLILSIPAFWISRQVYRSLVLQAYVNEDATKDKPEGHWQDYINAFPSIPNLNVRCMPTDILIARYLMADKKYDMALAYLNNSKKANPYLGYDALLKTRIFNELKNLDSAFYYARETFYTKPRTQYNYQVLSKICVARKDSNTLKSSFKEYIKYRNEPWAWNEYIYSLSNVSYSTPRLIAITDSALKLFPDDKDLQQKKLAFSQPGTNSSSLVIGNNKTNTSTTVNANAPVVNYSAEIMDYFSKATAAYSKADYNTAIKYFMKISELDPEDHLSLENIGLSYLAKHDYNKAIIYLDRSLQKNRSTDGKAEFYKGKALFFLGKTAEACEYFKLANGKKYVGAPQYLKMACK